MEQDILARSVSYYGKDKKSVTITVPIRDRNGDTVAAARIIMSTFPGQTEQNAFARGMPVAKAIESRISTLKELLD